MEEQPDKREYLRTLSEKIIGAAMDVHTAPGPGLLESVYESCLAFELTDRGFHVEQQKSFPVIYRNVHMEVGYHVDLLIEEEVIVEIKAAETLMPVHRAQLLSYLRLTGC